MTLRIAVAFVVIFFACDPVKSQTAINPNNGHLYVVTPVPMSYHAARAYAASIGGYIVSLNDAVEEQWVQLTFGTSEIFWIGLCDEAVEGAFVWESGEPVTYTNWCATQPDNNSCGGPDGQDYATMNWPGTISYPPCAGALQWDDAADHPGFCGGTNRAIIEIPAASGGGQANSSSSLIVNGIGGSTAPGPFLVSIPAGGTITFSWNGQPNQPLILITGPLNPGAVNVTGLGSIDVGTPPTFADVVVLVDPFSPWSPFFTTNANGTATQNFSLPSLPPGFFGAFQGAVYDPLAVFGVTMTAAFDIFVI